jgi:hypothetical protein
MPLRQTGQLPAAEPARVMARLCFHFSRKVPAQHDAAQGQVEFEWGCCRFSVRDQALDLELEAPDEERLQRLRGVIDAHVALFSRKQPLAVAWGLAMRHS